MVNVFLHSPLKSDRRGHSCKAVHLHNIISTTLSKRSVSFPTESVLSRVRIVPQAAALLFAVCARCFRALCDKVIALVRKNTIPLRDDFILALGLNLLDPVSCSGLFALFALARRRAGTGCLPLPGRHA